MDYKKYLETWFCDVCGNERPDAAISVRKNDVSLQHDCPLGTVIENLKYCNDNSDCARAVQTMSLAADRAPRKLSV